MGTEKDQIALHIPATTIAKVIFVGLLFVLAYIIRDILLVILAAVVFASSIEPTIKWFRARHVPRLIAVIFIYFGLALLFSGAFYSLFIPLIGETQQFLNDIPSYLGFISDEATKTVGITEGGAVGNLISTIPINNIVAQANAVVGTLSHSLFTTASAFFGGILSFFLIVVLSFYLSVQQDGILNFLKTISPSRHRKYIVDLWTRSENKIGLWLQGQLLLGIIVGTLTFLGLTLLGVKHSLLLGVVAGLFEIIPLFGPILAGIP
ncbi:MAG: AI-2E family transporter, partial [Patescibacteria group bacterium]